MYSSTNILNFLVQTDNTKYAVTMVPSHKKLGQYGKKKKKK